MIVLVKDSELRVITQCDHAQLASEILSLWAADGFPANPHRDDLLFAAREHDNGWREVDAAPYCDEVSGRPLDFLDIPRSLRFELWQRGIERHRDTQPYASLLILNHALRLHQSRREEHPDWQDFVGELEEFVEVWSSQLDVDLEQLGIDYRFLDRVDLISLSCCAGWPGFKREGLTCRIEGNRVSLDPFPLVGSTTFSVACRRIPDRRYQNAVDLAGELAATPWTETSFKLAPPEPTEASDQSWS